MHSHTAGQYAPPGAPPQLLPPTPPSVPLYTHNGPHLIPPDLAHSVNFYSTATLMPNQGCGVPSAGETCSYASPNLPGMHCGTERCVWSVQDSALCTVHNSPPPPPATIHKHSPVAASRPDQNTVLTRSCCLWVHRYSLMG